jgi:N-methylhydantoinase B
VLENRFPVRVWTFQLRPGSGGDGLHRGGDGTVRELEALVPLSGSIVSERRRHGAPGLSGGQPGLPGRNTLDGHDLGGKASFDWRPGSRLRIETPGGGGYGVAAAVGSADPAPTGEGEAS